MGGAQTMIAHHRHPWTPNEVIHLIHAKHKRVRHKTIARQLQRTPRSVDQQVARLKAKGLLQRMEAEQRASVLEVHREEELALLQRVLAEWGQ
jgi:predicted transcriptional regulator